MEERPLRMGSDPRIVQPEGWVKPKGYANAVVAQGEWVFIAGQVGWDPRQTKAAFPIGFAAQFDQALANVVEVLRAAGGKPTALVRMTVYVVNKEWYLEAIDEVTQAWRKHLGRHYPAMTLVEVTSLLEPAAKVEIEATAVL